MMAHEAGESRDLIPMQFEDYKVQMRVEDGVTWWSARGVMRVLGMHKWSVGHLMGRLDADEKRMFPIHTTQGPRETWFINEHGLYDLLMKSRKPEAERFKRWIKHEVLPEIRRTGGYNYMPTGERFFANTERRTQLQNSKAVVPILTRFGGRNDLITWFVDSVVGMTQASPKEWRDIGKASGLPGKVCQSGRAVVRELRPAAACAVSLADDLVTHNVDQTEAIAIAHDSIAIFQRIIQAGVRPAELGDPPREGSAEE